MTSNQISSWVTDHPAQTLGLVWAALSVVNGLLPASVKSGPVGTVIHAILDRISFLTRSDAAGTLKLPTVASAALRAAADSVDAKEKTP